ncbi:hypothetical protein [Propioniferax innocua]|nr:hypothetical protein [Propioniferax innocua]
MFLLAPVVGALIAGATYSVLTGDKGEDELDAESERAAMKG